MKHGYCCPYIDSSEVAGYVVQMADKLKELEDENEKLKAENENLKADNDELKERILDLEASA